jgi:hypothetical protein
MPGSDFVRGFAWSQRSDTPVGFLASCSLLSQIECKLVARSPIAYTNGEFHLHLLHARRARVLVGIPDSCFQVTCRFRTRISRLTS